MTRQHTGAIDNSSPLVVSAVAIALEEFPGLCPNGLTWGVAPRQVYTEPWQGHEIETAMRFLSPLGKTSKPTYSSYYLKHVLEDHLRRYVSNGAFIVACIASDFVVEPYGDGSLNAGIGISRRDIQKLRQPWWRMP
jgi:hypothetical protein